MIQTDILVIGGGLSGLSATWQLSRAGLDVTLLEARNRFGGRALTVQADDSDSDLGPSWFWEGQPLIDGLLKHFNIPFYEQYSSGAVLIEQADGSIINSPMASPMLGSRRIAGGVQSLVNALVNDIEASQRFLEHAVQGISVDGDMLVVDVMTPDGKIQIKAKQVAIAMPLRLASELALSPTLSEKTLTTLQSTPTWMAGHAKFFAVYEEAFWREKGLCGTAISRRGPLAEIHDASPNSDKVYSLFGFVGIPAQHRVQIGRERLIELATEQLVRLFGAQAQHPQSLYLQDWSAEEFTANSADRQAQTQHPHYGIKFDLDEPWRDKLNFIVSETASDNSGLIEGALSAGLNFAKQVSDTTISLLKDDPNSHTASMDWDWFSS